MNRYKLQKKLFNLFTFCYLMKYLKYSHTKNACKKERIRNKALKKLVWNAYKIPFYKERFDKNGVKPSDINSPEDLTRLPVLTKEELREWMVSEKANPENKDCMPLFTSGSSGRPLEILCTPLEYARDIANVLRAMMVAGYNPFFGKTLTEADDSSENVGYKTFVQRLGILRREIFDEDAPAEDIIKLINQYKPDLVRGYKSELVRIAIYGKNNSVKMQKPKNYLVLGESVDAVSERVLREYWGEGLLNLYGCVENGAIAIKKSVKGVLEKVYTVFDNACLINLYNDDNRLSDDGRVILTTLYKYRFPLINYELGDRATVERTETGLYIKELRGRQNDIIRYKNGEFSEWIQIWHVMANQTDILQVRLLQKSLDELQCQLVLAKDAKKNFEEIEVFLRNELEKVIKGRISLSFRLMDEIPLDPNGKCRMIVSEL